MDLKLTISASCTRKLNHGVRGGENFESSDIFVSESVEIPADASEEEKNAAREQVEYTVFERRNRLVQEEIKRIQGVTICRGKNCSAEVKGKFDYCYQCGQAKKEGGVKIPKKELEERKKPMEEDKNGAPKFN